MNYLILRLLFVHNTCLRDERENVGRDDLFVQINYKGFREELKTSFWVDFSAGTSFK